MKAWKMAVWLAGAAMVGPAFADSAKEPAAATSQSVDKDARDFFGKAHLFNQRQVALGLMALARAQTPEVRKLGEQVMHDAQKHDEELFKWAESQGLRMSDLGIGGSEDVSRAKLEKLAGKEFEQAFLTEVVQDASSLRDQENRTLDVAQLAKVHASMVKNADVHAKRAQDLLNRDFSDKAPKKG